jgi:hypothetical protein
MFDVGLLTLLHLLGFGSSVSEGKISSDTTLAPGRKNLIQNHGFDNSISDMDGVEMSVDADPLNIV